MRIVSALVEADASAGEGKVADGFPMLGPTTIGTGFAAGALSSSSLDNREITSMGSSPSSRVRSMNLARWPVPDKVPIRGAI